MACSKVRQLASQSCISLFLEQFSFISTRDKFIPCITQSPLYDQGSGATCLAWSRPLLLLPQTDTFSDVFSSQNPVPVLKVL